MPVAENINMRSLGLGKLVYSITILDPAQHSIVRCVAKCLMKSEGCTSHEAVCVCVS